MAHRPDRPTTIFYTAGGLRITMALTFLDGWGKIKRGIFCEILKLYEFKLQCP